MKIDKINCYCFLPKHDNTRTNFKGISLSAYTEELNKIRYIESFKSRGKNVLSRFEQRTSDFAEYLEKFWI